MTGQRLDAGGAHRSAALTARVLSCALGMWALGLATGVPPASADAPLTLASSPSNASGITPVTITAAVGSNTTAGSTLTVIVNPSTETCPTDPASEGRSPLISEQVSPNASIERSVTLEHGRYTICGWLNDTNPPTRAELPLTIADPDKLSLAVAPATATDGANSTVSVAGVADVPDPIVFITRKPSTSGDCAANPGADGGALLPDFDPAAATFGSFTTSFSVPVGTGSGGRPDQAPPGSYRLCAWLMDALGSKTTPLAGPQATMVTLTAPTGTLAYSLPELVVAPRRFSIATSYTTSAADVTLYVDLKPLPAHGRPCPSSQAADRGAVKTISGDVAGARTSTPMTLTTPGVYVACAWLEWPHGTIDGPFPGRFVVAGLHQRVTTYYGVTSQHLPRSKLHSSYPIVFQAIDGQVVNLAYFARFACTRPGRPTTHPIYSTSFPAFGFSSLTSFRSTFAQGTDRAMVHGRLRRRRATGTLQEHYTSGRYTCRSGPVTFSARRG